VRRLWLSVLMITLLLTACGGGEGNKAEELALTVRGTYLAAQGCSGGAVVTADYGQRIYRYRLDFQADEEQTVMTLTEPETVAGISARLSAREGSKLEYEGIMLETGPLDDSGLSPVSAVPALLETVREGYLDTCVLEAGKDGSQTLRLLSRDPEQALGSGIETTLWVSPDSLKLLRGEICRDGVCVIQCEFSDFEFIDTLR